MLELQVIVQLQKVFESASAAPVGLQSSPGGMSDVRI